MGEAQEVKRLRLPVATPLPILGGEPPELDQPRLLRMQRKTELRETLFQVAQESFGILAVLKAQHEIIGVPNDDDIALGIPFPPLLHPEVEGVVQIHVREQRRCHASNNVANRPFRGPVQKGRGTPYTRP